MTTRPAVSSSSRRGRAKELGTRIHYLLKARDVAHILGAALDPWPWNYRKG
jgi:hypothetical protein